MNAGKVADQYLKRVPPNDQARLKAGLVVGRCLDA